MEYSAGMTSKPFWLLEGIKTAKLICDGKTKQEMKELVWLDNIYQVKAEYRAYEVLNGTYNRLKDLPIQLIELLANADIRTAKIVNLVAILVKDILFLEFVSAVYAERVHLGLNEITERDLNEFFIRKQMESDIVAQWKEVTIKKLKSSYISFLSEAGMLVLEGKKKRITPIVADYNLLNTLRQLDMDEYLKIMTGEKI